MDPFGQIHIPVSRFFVLLYTHEQVWDLLDSCENHFSLSDQNLDFDKVRKDKNWFCKRRQT